MKTSKRTTLIAAVITAGAFLVSVNGMAQERKLPDGTIVYGDGTRKLPNGTVIYKGGTSGNPTVGNNGTSVVLPDGSVVYPDGRRTYPNNRGNNRRGNGKWLPPGQAKKIYGGSARDYAPGQQKKWKEHEHEHEHEHGKGHGKHGEGHDD
jgi:hypothetical protein